MAKATQTSVHKKTSVTIRPKSAPKTKAAPKSTKKASTDEGPVCPTCHRPLRGGR